MEDKKGVDYDLIFNELIKNIENKYEKCTINKSSPIFTYEFFVFHLFLPQQLIKTISNPILAFRLLDFPTQNIEGKVSKTDDHIIFNKGKSSFFEMELDELKKLLKNEPFYIMLIDKNKEEFNIIATSRVDISIFSFENFLDYQEINKKPIARRNILKLFDNTLSSVAEIDMSLLIRREYIEIDTNSNYPKPPQNKKIVIEYPIAIEANNQLNKIDFQINCDNLYKNNNNNNSNYLQNLPKVKEITNRKENISKSDNKMDNIKVEKINSKEKEGFQNQVYLDPSNPSAYVNNLKHIIESKSNPPALFYHNKKVAIYEKANITSEINKMPEHNNIKVESEKEAKNNEKAEIPNKNYIKSPPQRESKSKQIKEKVKHAEKYDEKMKKITLKTSSSLNKSDINKNSINISQTNIAEKDPFLEGEVNDNAYETLFSKINNENLIKKEKERNKFKRENKKNNNDSLIKANCNKEVINEAPLIISPDNKLNNSHLNSKEVSYGKEQFYEVSQLNNFTISQQFISNDFKHNSINERLKVIVEENINITPAKRNENAEKLKFQTKESSIKPISVIEESRNIIDVSEVGKEYVSIGKKQMDGEEEYKFDEYMNTINSKEEVIEENFSTKKENSLRKSDAQYNKSSSIKDLIDDEFLSSDQNRKNNSNNFVKCYMCQTNVPKSEAIEHAEKCKNLIISSAQESEIYSEIKSSKNQDSTIKESFS